ncbi:MAG: hypothetical protein KJ011_08210 [Burkholderiaceae bacterium]|nr:hypothetical protein [Burkholderiaceae bacterium]
MRSMFRAAARCALTPADRMRRLARVATGLLACAFAAPVLAWSNHAPNTWQALKDMPAFTQLQPVKAETLEAFLAAEAPRLEALLDEQERWAREHVPTYPPRPDALRFVAAGADAPGELRRRFLAAIRVAPDVRLALFAQRMPGQAADGRPSLVGGQVSTLADDEVVGETPYIALAEGEAVSPLAVVATASDEPDYGLDIGVWEDNDTAYGRTYGLGRQPFGNPALSFGTQAPFHMGFYHESAIIYAAAGFLKRTYPEYRIHLYSTLAQHALRTGHDYWGWRFAGWALHYIQDLVQPYHARVLPGVSTLRMLWINALDIMGWPDAKNRAITLVSNRHLAFENFQRGAILAEYRDRGSAGPLLRALAGAGPADERASAGGGGTAGQAGTGGGAGAQPAFDDDSPRMRVARRSADAADAVDRAVAQALPPRYVDDPTFEFGVDARGIDLYAQLGESTPAAREAMLRVLTPLMSEFGVHTRALVHALMAASR